jgi:hypothetical protein
MRVLGVSVALLFSVVVAAAQGLEPSQQHRRLSPRRLESSYR